MIEIGYDLRDKPGAVVVVVTKLHTHEMRAGDAEDLANRLLAAAKVVREHDRKRAP